MEPAETAPLVALEALLDVEMAAVRHANFTGLDGLSTRKEALLAELVEGPAPAAAALDRLRQKARRNAAALLAARRGLRAARRRIAELQTAESPETYGPDGRRTGLGPTAGQLEHRA